MDREKLPERVPFRLTRMMVRAFEVSGIEGNFRCATQLHCMLGVYATCWWTGDAHYGLRF